MTSPFALEAEARLARLGASASTCAQPRWACVLPAVPRITVNSPSPRRRGKFPVGVVVVVVVEEGGVASWGQGDGAGFAEEEDFDAGVVVPFAERHVRFAAALVDGVGEVFVHDFSPLPLPPVAVVIVLALAWPVMIVAVLRRGGRDVAVHAIQWHSRPAVPVLRIRRNGHHEVLLLAVRAAESERQWW